MFHESANKDIYDNRVVVLSIHFSGIFIFVNYLQKGGFVFT